MDHPALNLQDTRSAGLAALRWISPGHARSELDQARPARHGAHVDHHHHHVDAGALLLGEKLCRIEGKLDALLQRTANMAKVEARTLALVTQIATALEIGREAGSMTLRGEPPRPERT